MLELSMKQARRLMIGAQGLSGPTPKRPSKNKMIAAFDQLGAVQIDSINVVARSHQIVLWSRLGEHPPDWIYELQAEGKIFEYWVHACGYAPIDLYPCFRGTMLEFPDGRNKGTREWVEENQDVLTEVLEAIRTNGEMSISAFQAPADAEKPDPWSWFGNKPARVALSMLWSDGSLMVSRREKFQRYFDLTERVLPDHVDAEPLDRCTANRTLGIKAVDAMGITNARWLPDYFRTSARHIIRRAEAASLLEAIAEAGYAIPARIKGLDQDFYVSLSALERRFRPSRTTLLSPFDSLIWDRGRTKTIFDYEVKFEIYVPKAKREYGYFNLAILHRDEIVGQLDPKVHRKDGVLDIQALHLEPGFQPDERFYFELAESLLSFMRFNGACELTLGSEIPRDISEPLMSMLTELGPEHSRMEAIDE